MAATRHCHTSPWRWLRSRPFGFCLEEVTRQEEEGLDSVDHLQFLGVLGSGAFGTVHGCHHALLGKEVASQEGWQPGPRSRALGSGSAWAHPGTHFPGVRVACDGAVSGRLVARPPPAIGSLGRRLVAKALQQVISHPVEAALFVI